MSTKTISFTGAKPYGLTYDQFPIYKLNAGLGTKYEEVSTTASTPSLSPPYASVLRVDIDYNNDDFFQIDEHFLDFNCVNASATEAPTFMNTYGTMQGVRVLFNNVEVDNCKNYQEIQCRVSNYLREHSDNPTSAIARFSGSSSSYYACETVAVSSTVQFNIPMSVLFPWIKGFVIGGSGMVKRFQYEITFAQNYGSASANGVFVKSNTASNAYSTNLSYTNIGIRQVIVRPQPEARQALLSRVTPKLMRIAHEAKVKSLVWNTTVTDMTTFSLKTDWSSHSNVRGLIVFIEAPTEKTAYNDADNGKVYSGATIIGYKIRYNGTEVLNHSIVSEVRKRKCYSMAVLKKQWDKEMPLEVLNRSSGLADNYFFETYIDLQNIAILEAHEGIIAGVNTDNNIQIDVICMGAVAAGGVVNLYGMLEYVEEIVQDGKGNYKVMNNL